MTDRTGTRSDRMGLLAGIVCLPLLFLATSIHAADVLRPAAVQGLSVDRDADDLLLAWLPVTEDIHGFPETIAEYRVYRGNGPHWPADFTLVGTTASTTFTDLDAADAVPAYYYLLVAQDAAGHRSQPRPSTITTSANVSTSWTRFTVRLEWTDAAPLAEVTSYRIYYGKQPGAYEAVIDVGLAATHTFGVADLLADTQYFFAVAAVDAQGSESDFSVERYDSLAGTVKVRGHDAAHVCFGGCPPVGDEIAHDNGREIVVPVTFPAVDAWRRVTLKYTVDSRLCDDVPDICGPNNPGWNPCGDPWDRTTSVTLVLDDCVDVGALCYGRTGNLELIHAVTPFGTDADPPAGNGDVGPRVWSFDITPYTPLFTGTRYVSAFVGVWVSPGWYVTVDFEFTKVPQQTSPKPPADGIAQVHFRDGGGNVTGGTSVTIPATATQVKGRLFTTGHGGELGAQCDCAPSAPCDEFCQKTVEIVVDGAPVWSTIPWRTDCSPSGNSCANWNACGFPSCTFSRSGWCPGYIACHSNAPCDQDIDLTNWLAPGGTYEVWVNVPDVTTPGGSWANSLALYWYE